MGETEALCGEDGSLLVYIVVVVAVGFRGE
jgi:hypothetical protein